MIFAARCLPPPADAIAAAAPFIRCRHAALLIFAAFAAFRHYATLFADAATFVAAGIAAAAAAFRQR